VSSNTSKYELFKEKLKQADFRADVLDDPESTLKSIGISDPDFINVIKELVQGYKSDPSEHKVPVGAGPIEGKQGYRFHPI